MLHESISIKRIIGYFDWAGKIFNTFIFDKSTKCQELLKFMSLLMYLFSLTRLETIIWTIYVQLKYKSSKPYNDVPANVNLIFKHFYEFGQSINYD